MKNKTTTSFVFPIHTDGIKFIAAFAIVSLILHLMYTPLGMLGWIATAWCIYFFRDPDRVTPVEEGLVVSPADGVVTMIEEVDAPEWLDENKKYTRISVFLNIFNVHVNRMPIASTIKTMNYIPGKFLNASLDKASEHNERMCIALETASGSRVGLVQIAGLIARRIRTDVEEGQAVETAERYGLIRFGSRVDVYLPPKIAPQVMVGQTMIAGETVMAYMPSSTKAKTAK